MEVNNWYKSDSMKKIEKIIIPKLNDDGDQR